MESEKQTNGPKYTVEGMLNIYARDFALIQASELYNPDAIEEIKEISSKCHIYIVGLAPIIEIKSANEVDGIIHIKIFIGGQPYRINITKPANTTFIEDNGTWYCKDIYGNKLWMSPSDFLCKVSEQTNALDFKVLYIGQAYGKDGQRNAIDRLIEHKTLQQISLQKNYDNQDIQLLLLGIGEENTVHTWINPYAVNDEHISKQRFKNNLDLLHNMTEFERICLYEACLIRYFQPEYNIKLKNKFPSTNMKILSRCYEKDFQSVIAEICIPSLAYKLFSDKIIKKSYHIARFDLHNQQDRTLFFSKPDRNETLS